MRSAARATDCNRCSRGAPTEPDTSGRSGSDACRVRDGRKWSTSASEHAVEPADAFLDSASFSRVKPKSSSRGRLEAAAGGSR